MASSLLAVRREYLGCCMMSHAVNNSMLGCHEDVSEFYFFKSLSVLSSQLCLRFFEPFTHLANRNLDF